MRDDPNIPNTVNTARRGNAPIARGVAIAAIAIFTIVLALVLRPRVGNREPASEPTALAPIEQPVTTSEQPAPPIEPETEAGPPVPDANKPELVVPGAKPTRRRAPRIQQIDDLQESLRNTRPPKEVRTPPKKPREVLLPRDATLASRGDQGREISPAQIRAVVAKHESQVERCYRDPNMRARREKVEVAIAVAPSGEVARAQVKHRLPGDLVASCISRSARTWKFPAPGGDVEQEIVVPFVLVPGSRQFSEEREDQG